MSTKRLSWLLFATQVPSDGSGGGVVRYAVELATALRARDDIELTVLARRSSADFFRDLLGAGGHVATTPNLPTPALSLLERSGVGLRALQRPFDVVHGTKHLIPRVARGVEVLTVHDMLAVDRPEEFGQLKRTLLVRPYLASLRQASVLLCVSKATEDRVAAHVPGAERKSSVVHLATSTALRETTASPVPSLLGRRFALVVGDPSPRKNLRLAVDIWPEVVRRAPGAVLAMVGPPGWTTAHRGDRYDELRAAGSLQHLGYLSDGELRWCYENAAVVLCPSHAEGFGLPALEALSFGAPLITSDDPALCEVSGPTTPHLPSAAGDLWIEPVAGRLLTGRAPTQPADVRTWHDVAAETVAAVRGPGH